MLTISIGYSPDLGTFGSPHWPKSALLVRNSPNQTCQAGVSCQLRVCWMKKSGCCDGMSLRKSSDPLALGATAFKKSPQETLQGMPSHLR